MQIEDAFASSRTWDLNQRNFTVEPGLCSSPGPFIFHCHGELRSLTAMLNMEIKATVLQQQLNPVNIYLPRLIVKLVSFCEAFSGRDTLEAQNCPNIFRLLNNGIGGELMYLYLKFQ
jgi:hypothetical protein